MFRLCILRLIRDLESGTEREMNQMQAESVVNLSVTSVKDIFWVKSSWRCLEPWILWYLNLTMEWSDLRALYKGSKSFTAKNLNWSFWWPINKWFKHKKLLGKACAKLVIPRCYIEFCGTLIINLLWVICGFDEEVKGSKYLRL